MSSAYQSMIDAALRNARAMASTGVEKTASEQPNDLYKEASELANALEYMAITSVDDGTAAGVAQSDMIKDFFKQASKQRMGAVPHGSTSSVGVQSIAPSKGKLRLNETQSALNVTSGPNTTGNHMLESYKQASLYDILMGKHAEHSPAQYTSDEYLSISNANENSVRGVLDSNDSVVGFQRRDVHGNNIRARLAEAFSHTNDSLSDQTASAIFPQATAAGGLKKTASSRNRLEKLAYRGRLAAGLIGATGGAGVGALAGQEGKKGKGALIGALAGGAAAGGGAQLIRSGMNKRYGKQLVDQLAGRKGQLAAERAMDRVSYVQRHGLDKGMGGRKRIVGGMALGTLGVPVAAGLAASKGTKEANAGQFINTIGGRALAGGGLGAAAGGVGGYMAGGDAGSALTGAALGGIAGAAGGGLMQRAALKNVGAAEKAIAATEQAGYQAMKDQQYLQQLENLEKAQQAVQGGLGAGAGVAGGAGLLAGIGGGMLAKKASSPLSARSRIRTMQRGL